MSKTLGIVMDPIESIKPYKDSSFAMLLEAQRRGWKIVSIAQADISLRDSKVLGLATELTVIDDRQNWFTKGSSQMVELATLDALLMRKDPPFDMNYIYSTYLLELAEQQGLLVINRAQSLRDCNEKLYTAWFPELCPATLVTASENQVRDFITEHKDIILKPLDGMGGASIFRLKQGDPNIGVTIETLTHNGSVPAMAQKFLPEIVDGDKRVLIVDGQVIPYALARIPAKGETRGNLAVGGTGRPQPLSESDHRLAETIAPDLVKRGILFAGIDVIGEYVTEINVTSPTCIRELDDAYDLNIAGVLFDSIERRLAQRDS